MSRSQLLSVVPPSTAFIIAAVIFQYFDIPELTNRMVSYLSIVVLQSLLLINCCLALMMFLPFKSNHKDRGIDHDHSDSDEQSEEPFKEISEHPTEDGKLEEIDFNGDIIIKVSPPEVWPFYFSERAHNHPRCFRVSPRALVRGSRFFKASLEGPWLEGQALRTDATATLHLSDIDTSAFLILLNLLHLRFQHVPEAMTTDQLTALAVQVDYFQCEDILARFQSEGYSPLGHEPMAMSVQLADARWVFVAWMFGAAKLFRSVTEIIQRQRQGSFDTLGLPIPIAIQSEFKRLPS